MDALQVMQVGKHLAEHPTTAKLFYVLQGLRRRGWIDEEALPQDRRIILLVPSQRTKRYVSVLTQCMEQALREVSEDRG